MNIITEIEGDIFFYVTAIIVGVILLGIIIGLYISISEKYKDDLKKIQVDLEESNNNKENRKKLSYQNTDYEYAKLVLDMFDLKAILMKFAINIESKQAVYEFNYTIKRLNDLEEWTEYHRIFIFKNGFVSSADNLKDFQKSLMEAQGRFRLIQEEAIAFMKKDINKIN